MSPIIVGSESPSSQGVGLIVDSTTVDAANTEFVINDGSSRFLLSELYPLPEPDVIYAQPIDADGDIPAHMRYRDRQGCQVTFVIQGSTAAALETTLGQWSQKLAKLNREGGTLLRTTPNGTSAYLIIRPSTFAPTFDRRYVKNLRCEVTWTFPAWSFWIGTAVQQTDTTETTLPYITKTATGPAGDVAAWGKLLIDDDSGNDQFFVVWGLEDNSAYDVTAASAALYFEAEGRTPLNSSATAVGPSGASGGGSNVVRNTQLTTTLRAILSTQATGGGAHLTHVGTFKVFARVQVPTSNTGTVSVAFEWSLGDYRRFSQNNSHSIDTRWEGQWMLVDLGAVTLPKPLSGVQRWEGRVLAKSTVAGDDIDVDFLLLIPTSGGWGQAAGVTRIDSPGVYSARDEFDQTAGNLTGKTLPVGGTWTGAGSATDATVSGSGLAQRTASADSSGLENGRFLTASTPTLTTTVVQVDVRTTAAGPLQAVVARYTDINNWFAVALGGTMSGGNGTFSVIKRVGGSVTTISTTSYDGFYFANTWYTLRLAILSNGNWYFWRDPTSTQFSSALLTGSDAVLATGGTLASGKAGMADRSSTVSTRDYDNFAAWTPSDAAMFASQSLEVRYDGIIREDSAGAIWSPVSNYEGDLLRVPVAGRENRSVRWIVKASRYEPGVGPDSGIDDISARLTQIPLYLTVPSP